MEQTSCTRSLVNTTKRSGRHTLRFCFVISVLSMMVSIEGLGTCVFLCSVDWLV